MQKVSKSGRDNLILELTLAGRSVKSIAAELGLHRSTVQRVIKRRQQELAELRRERLERLTNKLGSEADRALGELDALLRDPLAPHSVRLNAIRLVLEAYQNYLKLSDFEARIQKLEELAGIGGNR